MTTEEHNQLSSLIEKADLYDIIEKIIIHKQPAYFAAVFGGGYHDSRTYGDENRIIAEIERLKLTLLGAELL